MTKFLLNDDTSSSTDDTISSNKIIRELRNPLNGFSSEFLAAKVHRTGFFSPDRYAIIIVYCR